MFTLNRNSFLLNFGNLLCFFCLVFLFFYFYTEHFIFWDIFTARDIQRALGWLEGQFYWPGPEMSGGGNLPGPFFYFLLFPPLIFGENIYSQAVLWHITWISLTYTVAFYFVTKITAHKESNLIFLFTFITVFGTGILNPITFAWNPSFAIMFHVLAIMNLYLWKQTNKSLYLYLTGLIVALGIQVHFLVLVHTITTLFLYFFRRKNELKPILIFCLLVSLPFLIYNGIMHLDLFETYPMSTTHLYGIKDLLFSEEWFLYIREAFIFNLIPVIFFVILSVKIEWRTKKYPVTQSSTILFIMMIIPILTAILSTADIPWYLYFVPVFLILLLSKWYDDLMSDDSDKNLNLLIVYGILCIISIFLFENNMKVLLINHLLYLLFKINVHHIILLSIPLIILLLINIEFFSWKYLGKMSLFLLLCFFTIQIKDIKWLTSYRKVAPESFSHKAPTYQELHPIMKKIFLDTNWSPKDAMNRIYSIGIHPERDLLTYYSMSKEKVAKNMNFNPYLNQFSESIPNGYMIIQHLKKFIDYSHEDWKQHLSHSSLFSHFLSKEIKEGKVLIENPQLYDTYWLIPYQTTKESVFPEGFSNVGQPYHWEEPDWLKNCSFTQQFKNKDDFYYCMILPGYLQRAGVHIKISNLLLPVKDNISTPPPPHPLVLDINFSGPLLGSVDCCSSGYRNTLWSDFQISISCNTKRIKYSLPDIGLDFELQEKDAAKRAKLFAAPLKLQIPIKKKTDEFLNCKKDELEEIELIFSHTRKYQNHLPAEKRIVWKIN